MSSFTRSFGLLVAAAAVSGYASFATEGLPQLSHDAQAQLTSYMINPNALLAGVWFGLVTGALAWTKGSRGAAGAIFSFLATWIAWQMAIQVAIATFDRLGAMTSSEDIRMIIAGFAAGAVGAFVTFLGVRASVAFSRTGLALLSTVAVGAAFGMLLLWSMTEQSAGLLLYATWQPAVIAVMALFARSRPAPAGSRELRVEARV
ncbi:MAG: hypothetical protein KJZ80_02390 [Hyphomicrobiaceae bacterium]|nr:hypothetical protein [Hyphomicrobiaceae bacterium]